MEYILPYRPELNVRERIWHHIRHIIATNRHLDLIEHAICGVQRR
jgi:hypothetical protein